jgi:hypothetical protein
MTVDDRVCVFAGRVNILHYMAASGVSVLFRSATILFDFLMRNIFRVAPNFLGGALYLIGDSFVSEPLIANSFAYPLFYLPHYLIHFSANLILVHESLLEIYDDELPQRVASLLFVCR